MFDVGFIAVFAAHLLCMNVAAAGPLVCIYLEWREARGSEIAGQAGRFLAASAVVLLIIGSLLGLMVGWLLWTPQYRELLARLPSKIYFGVWELGFSLILMLAHLAWWHWKPRAGALQRSTRTALPLLAGTNLMYHFPLLFAVIGRMAAAGQWSGEVVDAAGFRQRIIEGHVLAMAAHFVMASLAGSGLMLMLFTLLRGQDEATAERRRPAIWGARLALGATLLQLPIGMWLLTQLPQLDQVRLMGGDFAATGCFVVSLLLALWLMHQLAAVAMGDTSRRALIWPLVTLVAVILLMTAALHRSRQHPHSAGTGRGDLQQTREAI